MTVPAAHMHPQLWMNRYAVAGGGFVLAAILTAIGTFRDSTSNAWSDYLVVLAIALVATIVVFWLIVPQVMKGAKAGTIGMTALILGVVGFLSLSVFWIGLPAVLAAGAAYLATNVDRHTSGMPRTMAVGAIVLAAVTVVLAIVLAIVG